MTLGFWLNYSRIDEQIFVKFGIAKGRSDYTLEEIKVIFLHAKKSLIF